MNKVADLAFKENQEFQRKDPAFNVLKSLRNIVVNKTTDINQIKPILQAAIGFSKQRNRAIIVEAVYPEYTCGHWSKQIRRSEIGKSVIFLECWHTFCDMSWVKEALLKQQGQTFYSCPTCTAQVESSWIQTNLGEAFLKQLLETTKQPSFNCLICLIDIVVASSITNDCDHRMCIDCFKDYTENLIINRQCNPHQMICPFTDWKQEITPFMLQAWLPEDIFDKYGRFMAEDYRSYEQDEVHITWPSRGWGHSFIVSRDSPIVVWPFCRVTICTMCGRKDHRPDTCQVNSAKENGNEAATQQALEALGVQTCPHCNAMVEKSEGCNFVSCPSSECKKLNFFCFLCLKKLNRLQHYSHFHKVGPFGSSCNTMDGIQDMY